MVRPRKNAKEGGVRGGECGNPWKKTLSYSSPESLSVCVCVCGGDADISPMKLPICFCRGAGVPSIVELHIHSLMSWTVRGDEDAGGTGPCTVPSPSLAAGQMPPMLSRHLLGPCLSLQPGIGRTASSLPVEGFLLHPAPDIPPSPGVSLDLPTNTFTFRGLSPVFKTLTPANAAGGVAGGICRVSPKRVNHGSCRNIGGDIVTKVWTPPQAPYTGFSLRAIDPGYISGFSQYIQGIASAGQLIISLLPPSLSPPYAPPMCPYVRAGSSKYHSTQAGLAPTHTQTLTGL